MSVKRRIQSFGYAFKGIALAWKGKNFRIQLGLMLLAFALATILDFSKNEWLIVCLVSALVLSLETVNTALEELVNMVSPEYHELAGKVKDLAAGAVLISAIFAAVIGVIMYLPKLWEYVF